MIRHEQIPDEVVEAALRAYTGNNCECNSCRKAVVRTIAAALNAWPHVALSTHVDEGRRIVLPLPKDAADE